MKDDYDEQKWIWQSSDFPNFTYLSPPLDELFYKFGQISTIEKFLGTHYSKELLLDVMSDEVMSTSLIEGEILQRSSVRSSVNKILKLGIEENYRGSLESDFLVQIIIDAKTNHALLDKLRLSSWHKALFPAKKSGLMDINSGEYRTHEEEMKILSGAFGKEKIHYIAPPSSEIERMMELFFEWLNADNETNLILKSIVAHLYFVLIHPFEDGNGRLARAINDYILSLAKLSNASFYSISFAISDNRKEYYALLDDICTKEDLDISKWIEWFVGIIHKSLDETLLRIKSIEQKTLFWDRFRDVEFNARQKKVILKMLSTLPAKFEGGMRVQKYVTLTKTTRITANRDLLDLIAKGVMQSFGSGRGVYYELNLSV